jgi:hypothetical protein
MTDILTYNLLPFHAFRNRWLFNCNQPQNRAVSINGLFGKAACATKKTGPKILILTVAQTAPD